MFMKMRVFTGVTKTSITHRYFTFDTQNLEQRLRGMYRYLHFCWFLKILLSRVESSTAIQAIVQRLHMHR